MLLFLSTRRGRRIGLAAGTAAAGAVILPLLLLGSLGSPSQSRGMNNVSCAAPVALDSGGLELTAEQARNSEVIVTTGARMGIPVRGRVVAIATALQESGLRNLDHGDRDSLGLFQQRPSQGWGTAEQIMNPHYSAYKFYAGLQQVRGWQDMPVTDAAQAVQRSGFPTAYAKHESRAASIVARMTEGGIETINAAGCTPLGNPGEGSTHGYLSIALKQVGKPYVWGGVGPDGFDCSGLIVYAWRQVGFQLKIRTSEEMYSVSVPVPSGQEQPGDLIFSRFEAGGPAHVLIVVKPGIALEAPRTGLNVRVRPYNAQSEGMRFGRLPETQMTPVATA